MIVWHARARIAEALRALVAWVDVGPESSEVTITRDSIQIEVAHPTTVHSPELEEVLLLRPGDVMKLDFGACRDEYDSRVLH